MKTKNVTPLLLTLFLVSTLMCSSVAFAAHARFETVAAGLVIRHPQKARTDKNFNVGIYVDDALVETSGVDSSGGDYGLAELFVTVSGPGVCTMWNDWFEAQSSTISPTDDLIVEPFVSGYLPGPDGIMGTGDDVPILEYSMEYDEEVSKLDDIPGWTGSVVCNADTAGTYTFTLSLDGADIGSFTINVD